jgi:ParB family chromosome partitioning protein
MQLELEQVEMKYEALRVAKPLFQSRLMASLASEGQLQPVLVVRSESEAERYVLIDGYRRVWALKALYRDTLEAMVLALSETAGLIFRHSQHSGHKTSALEEGWLIEELVSVSGMSQAELSRRLERSESWISRRLSLVRQLPESVQQLVRAGRLCSHGAGKYLVPLARAKRSDCEKLASHLGADRTSSRQLQAVYTAYKSTDAEGRRRVVENPRLFLKSAEQLKGELGDKQGDDIASLIADLEILEAVSARARRRVRAMSGGSFADTVVDGWRCVQSSFAGLSKAMEKRIDAG